MHAKPDLRVFLKWMVNRSGSVITDVIRILIRIFHRSFRKLVHDRVVLVGDRMSSVQLVLHQAMHSARMEVDKNDGFTPFALAADGDKVRVVATAGIEITDLNHGIEVYRQCLAEEPADAVIFCIDVTVPLPDTEARAPAIYFILENEQTCICGQQIYYRNNEGQMLFCEIETEGCAPTFFNV